MRAWIIFARFGSLDLDMDQHSHRNNTRKIDAEQFTLRLKTLVEMTKNDRTFFFIKIENEYAKFMQKFSFSFGNTTGRKNLKKRPVDDVQKWAQTDILL